MINRNPFVSLKMHEGQYFLIHEKNVYHLSGISKEIWDKIEEGVSEEDLIKQIVNEYDVNERTAQKDIKKLLKQFKKDDIIL